MFFYVLNNLKKNTDYTFQQVWPGTFVPSVYLLFTSQFDLKEELNGSFISLKVYLIYFKPLCGSFYCLFVCLFVLLLKPVSELFRY